MHARAGVVVGRVIKFLGGLYRVSVYSEFRAVRRE